MVANLSRPCRTARMGSRQKIAAFVSPGGKIVRLFVTRLFGVTDGVIRCVRQRLVGRQTTLRLPKAGFVVWKLGLHDHHTEVQVVKPAAWRGQRSTPATR